MARKLKEFNTFNLRFRTMQIGAVSAFAEVSREGMPDPMDVLPLIEVQVGEEWIRLDSREKVNRYVRESTGFIPAYTVLESILMGWLDVNTGFLKTWKPIRVPNYLRGDTEVRQAAGIDPIVAAIINSGKASLRELEEYYSLEDAIRLFDVNMAANITSADAHYVATKKAELNRR
jgi:hypothetical protein